MVSHFSFTFIILIVFVMRVVFGIDDTLKHTERSSHDRLPFVISLIIRELLVCGSGYNCKRDECIDS